MELGKDKLEKIFSLAGINMPQNCDDDAVSKALISIESKLSTSNKVKSEILTQNSLNILIVDDLEISLHQLNLLLSKSGHNATVARSFDEAKDEINKLKFDYIILDLYLPDSSDGFGLIDYIKSNSTQSKFIVISGSEDNDLIEECMKKGATTFVPKAPNWHKVLLQTITSHEASSENKSILPSYSIAYNENNICCIKIKFIESQDDVNHIKTEVASFINLGYKKIIFDFKGMRDYPLEFSSLFVDIYKGCVSSNVEFLISSVEECVENALKYIFLYDAIKIYPSAIDAIES